MNWIDRTHESRSGIFRLSLLDAATILVLALAVFLVSTPGGPLYNVVHGWLASRRTVAEVQREWPALTRLAEPLYAGGGPPDIIEFSDYQCPFCRSDQAAVDSAVARGLRVAVVQLPLPIHPRARLAALAALCAAAAGEFPSAHRFLMSNDQWMVSAMPMIVPGAVNARSKANYGACESAAPTERRLEEQTAMAATLAISATPSFVSDRGVLAAPPTLAGLLEFAGGK